MQLHHLKSQDSAKKSKRVGRGGKRGTYSGHGMKGQKARAGARIRPGFRGGDNPIWKLFPKQRGATKKVEVKHRTFSLTNPKSSPVNLSTLHANFKDGETVSVKSLLKRGIVSSSRGGIKILAGGVLGKKLIFSGVEFSAAAKEKALQSGSTIK
jgi:large subunit ribosomal protein L15